jgi:hypothetical protein
MPQHFRLDRFVWIPYLAVSLGACGHPAPVPAPTVWAPVTPLEATQWAEATSPTGHRLMRFRWLFNDGQASVGGPGSARFAGPDSLRFDIAGPFGIGNAAAAVAGDRALWVEPPDIIARLIPSYPLMWAMFGVMRPPPPGASVRGFREGGTTSLQAVTGTDSLEYRLSAGPSHTLRAEWRRAGTVMGVVETRLNPDGSPVSARLTVPSVPARLDITIVADSAIPAFPASVWAHAAR